jgi:hypothetical protein
MQLQAGCYPYPKGVTLDQEAGFLLSKPELYLKAKPEIFILERIRCLVCGTAINIDCKF